MSKTQRKHRLITPCTGPGEVHYLDARGRWRQWNGKTRARAFSYRDGHGYPIALAAECTCDEANSSRAIQRCVMTRALRYTAARFGAANGMTVDG